MGSFWQSIPGRVVRALTIVAIGAGLVYSVRFAELAVVLFNVLYDRSHTSVSAKNTDGDEVTSVTDLSSAPDRPLTTTIRLKRARGWAATNLLSITSYGLRVGLIWRDGRTLDLLLDFDCGAVHTVPVERDGPIRIRYHFGDQAALPEHGYAVIPARVIAQEPCF